MWLCFDCGVNNQGHTQAETGALRDLFMQRMGEIISAIREIFSGKVYVGEAPQQNDKRVADKVDGINFNFPNLLNDDEVAIATVDLIEQKATAYLEQAYNAYHYMNNQPCRSRASSNTTQHKMIFNLPAQSHTVYLSRG